MKKMMVLLMLASGINGTISAQKKSSADDKTFDVPEGSLYYRFHIDLGKGNSMLLEFGEWEDIQHFKNTDSLLAVFFSDMLLFKDSLSDELAAKHIDYLVDRAGRKRIRIQSYRPGGASFLIRQGEVSALRSVQDTVNIIGIVTGSATGSILKSVSDFHYYRISFFINQLNDLKDYRGTELSSKIAAIRSPRNSRWKKDKSGDWHDIKGDATVSAKNPGGMISGAGDYLEGGLSVGIQNYKNYFVPSLSLGMTLAFNNGRTKQAFTVAWEPQFLFAKNASGSMQTYRNDFLTISYGQRSVKYNTRAGIMHIDSDISFGRLIRKSGDFYEKNTFRLGLDQISFHGGRIKIEPCFYFTDFFKHATPGIKLSVSL